jgi:hypothetical protein
MEENQAPGPPRVSAVVLSIQPFLTPLPIRASAAAVKHPKTRPVSAHPIPYRRTSSIRARRSAQNPMASRLPIPRPAPVARTFRSLSCTRQAPIQGSKPRSALSRRDHDVKIGARVRRYRRSTLMSAPAREKRTIPRRARSRAWLLQAATSCRPARTVWVIPARSPVAPFPGGRS